MILSKLAKNTALLGMTHEDVMDLVQNGILQVPLSKLGMDIKIYIVVDHDEKAIIKGLSQIGTPVRIEFNDN